MIARLLIALALVLPQAGCGTARTCSPGDGCIRVLFIGNSYTHVNDLPGMFSELARSGGHEVETDALDEGGATLGDHQTRAETGAKLAEKHWDDVILQEQSQIPSVASSRDQQMYPAARQLVQRIRVQGSKPLLYLTWARQVGWPENGMADFAAMQREITSAYLTLGTELRTPVVPAGVAWQQVVDAQPNAGMWQPDGSHPTVKGTYLVACVFYASLFRQSPVGLSYHSDVSDTDAGALQATAASVVLNNPSLWGLGQS